MSFTDFLIKENIDFRTNEQMCEHTTFRIGGAADWYVLPDTAEQLIALIDYLRAHGISYVVCGNMSNTVFDDDGYHGAVIDLRRLTDCNFLRNGVCVGAGYPLTLLAKNAAERSLSGLEFAYGIPGTVGGGIFMNAGAYGGQLSDLITSVSCYDPVAGVIKEFDAKVCEFGYRHSIFSSSDYVILSCTMSLCQGQKNDILSQMESYMQARRDKQPLDKPNAGSVFKRPEGAYVGKMIEELGLKGYAHGGVAISDKHAGFMVNLGGGTCSDLENLILEVKTRVEQVYGISLECEIRFVR